MARGHRGTRHALLRLFGTPRALGAATPSRLGDRGAVAFEFALIFPVVLLAIAGMFGIGAVMIEDMQLTFIVQEAAKVEVSNPSQGVAWANTALPWASFTATPCGPPPDPGTQVTGLGAITLGILPSVTLSAQACSHKTP
jgi:hypothetical protein